MESGIVREKLMRLSNWQMLLACCEYVRIVVKAYAGDIMKAVHV